MIFTLVMHGTGFRLADVDFSVPPMPGDIVLRSDSETVRQRLRVVERRFIFQNERETAPCFIIVEPEP